MKTTLKTKIAFVAPSCAIDRKALEPSVKWFETQGFEPVFMPHLFASRRYTAGTAQERASDLNEAFERTDIKAVFCVRGGAGSAQILPFLDEKLIGCHPKPLFGLSDSTAVQNGLYARTGNLSYSGFLPIYDFRTGTIDARTAQSLSAVLQGKKQTLAYGTTLNDGQATGIALGGCLSVFCQLCGTPYFPDLTDRILFVEDIGEKTYKIEALLTQLSRQKGFSHLKGLIFGQFKNCFAADENDGSIQTVISEFAENMSVPVVADFPYGHDADHVLLPIGAPVTIHAARNKTFVEYGAF
jgi:muramoyltetrapeptide carboxypeptidase